MIITARGSSNLALTILWLHSIYIYSCVTAQTVKYGVYFDTTNGSPNPFGDGYYPQSQKFWSLVDSASYPIFLNWGKYLEDPSKWNNGNQCKDRSSATYGTNHRQSPIKLQKDDTCIDRHRTRVLDPGVCAKDEARFYTTPYGLGVDTTKCNRYWWYDHSRNPDPWYLQEIRIITPSEHTVLKSTGETQYVGELQLAFKGTVDHKAKIAITGIFLAVNPSGKADAEVEKLLVGWEAYQSNVYRSCNKAFNSQTCSLVPTSNPVSAPIKPKPVPVPTKPLKPVPAPTKPKLAPQVKPVPLPTKKPKTRKLEECWTGGGCPGSYYCFPELYWQATDGNGSHHHWRYSGSLTYPPCTENVEWRVMFGTLQISQNQLDRIEALIYKHLDPLKCTLTTVGTPRGSTKCPCCVNTNRMRQSLSNQMNLQQCDTWSTTSTTPAENATSTITSTAAPSLAPSTSTKFRRHRQRKPT